MHECLELGDLQGYVVSRGGNGSGNWGVPVGRMGSIPPGLSSREYIDFGTPDGWRPVESKVLPHLRKMANDPKVVQVIGK